MSERILETRVVGKIEGHFIVEAYQRGYRWDEEIEILLNDLKNIKKSENYCLQPIVVKQLESNTFELIDGQQRLTSLFIIQKYLRCYIATREIKYSLNYKTRKSSKDFLDGLDFNQLPEPNNASNLDELFIIKAAKRVKEWFEKQYLEINDRVNACYYLSSELDKRIFVIWYQVDSSEDSRDLFTRLNIGKIPLTNAELIKALFLSRNNGIDDKKQLEIASDWDYMEKELHSKRFWAFITNKPEEEYSTRIELLFDLIADKFSNTKHKEQFFTFFYFAKQISEKKRTKEELWEKVRGDFEHLKEWYGNRDLYHKIGYLIAINEIKLEDFILQSEVKTKSEIAEALDKKIKASLNFDDKAYEELSYDNDGDCKKIERILLLFNIETTRGISDESQVFPFEKHKGKAWSLEHIHAQQSEGLNTIEACQEWLILRKSTIEELDSKEHKHEDLINEMQSASEDKNLNIASTFNELFEKVVNVLSEGKESEYKHQLSNMALLSIGDNAALSNSTFSVKRDLIIKMDKDGNYIPICTRRVFLKYYTPSKDNNLFFWGEKDRKAYIAEMNKVLGNYLKEKITL